MEQAVTDFIVSETKLAEQVLASLHDALVAGRPVDVGSTLRSYVLHRFLLEGVVAEDMDSIEDLANESMIHTLQITGGDLDAAGIITGCGGETTWVTKKVKLLFAVQDALGIRFDPRGIARIRTVGDLADEVTLLWSLRKQAIDSVGATGNTPSQATAFVRDDEDAGTGTEADPSFRFDEEGVGLVRAGFPLFDSPDNPPVYLDNAATTQIPQAVLDAVERFCSYSYANVHRGIYGLSEQSTECYEHARETVARFIGVSPSRIAFVSGTTEALNLVALGLQDMIKPGDRIVVTAMEHHSNYLPWLRLAKRTGAEFKIVPLTFSGELNRTVLDELMEPPTKLVAIAHCSNVLGTVNPVTEICARAKDAGILSVVDGAQGVRHGTVDMMQMGCSFYAFSGHKLMAGPGIGVLYAADDFFERIEPPFQGGGMVKSVVGTNVRFESSPHSWESGTPNVVGAVALEAALAYRTALGIDALCGYEEALLDYTVQQLKSIPHTHILGKPQARAGCVSFTADGKRAVEVSEALALRGICVRAGHHCAMPLHRSFGKEASVRISPALYNTFAEIDECMSAIEACMLH